NNCKSLQVAAKGALLSGAYTVQNSAGQSFRIYCLFKDGYGYTFLSKNTNVAVDMGSLYDDKTHVLVRFTKSNKQYESTLAQIDSFASVPLSVQYNGYTGYNRPQNFGMTPYIYVGFIPKSYTSKGARQGWKTNGQEQIFTNCDANPNSYIMFMFNNANKPYTSYAGSKNSLMYKWYDEGTLVTSSDYVTNEFLTIYHEIHHGGCGGYSRGSNVPTFANIGLKFISFLIQFVAVQCAVPDIPTGATMTYTGTAIGDTATYGCKPGYQKTGGDTSRKCGGSGQWLGSDIVCTMGDYGIAIFCERTKGHLRCPLGKKLAIYSAMYGRTEGDTICDHRSARKTSNTECTGVLPGRKKQRVSGTLSRNLQVLGSQICLRELINSIAKNNCKSLQVIAKGALPSGAYTVQNSAGESFRIYCLFKDGYGYTFLSKNTNVAVDMGSLYDDKTHVLVRFTKSNKQYESTLAQIDSFASVPLSIQYNGYTGYNKPINFGMTPYIYVGFIPKSYTSKGARQGWKTNGQEQIFTNCDANPNSYIMFMFNNANKPYTSYAGSKNSLMYKWYDEGTLVPSSDYVSNEFLTIYHEIHHGGCGGYSRGS
ncbi:hypothetical protein MAR_026016, partial [Mya arenaria]